MIPGPDESRIPTAAPAVLDQASRVGLFINAAAMIGFGSPPISHLLGPLQGVRVAAAAAGRSEHPRTLLYLRFAQGLKTAVSVLEERKTRFDEAKIPLILGMISAPSSSSV